MTYMADIYLNIILLLLLELDVRWVSTSNDKRITLYCFLVLRIFTCIINLLFNL